MKQVIDCPCCNGGKLHIEVSNGYKVVTDGAMRDLPCITWCKNCNRKVRYKVVKEEEK